MATAKLSSVSRPAAKPPAGSLEPLARSVLLHHHVRNLFDSLVAGKALAAFFVEALAAAANCVAFAALARVHDLVADVTAEWTFHLIAPSPILNSPNFNPSCTMNSRPAMVTGTTEIACSTIAAPTAVSLSAPKNDVAPMR